MMSGRALIIVSILMLFCSGFPVSGQSKGTFCIPVRSLDEERLAFGPGESLDYDIHYRWKSINADVAKANVTLDTLTLNGVPVFHAKVFGRTARFYDIFFKVREHFETWFSRDGIVPQRFYRDSREGGYYSINDYEYRRDGDEPRIIASLETSRKGAWTETLPLTDCTFDLPALFYMARNMNFSKVRPNMKYPMTFVIDDDVTNVYFIWLGREKKYIKGIGTVKTMKFAAKLVAGEVFSGDTDMSLWVSDDENRIPVCFEAPLKVGVASGRLTGWKNLKHPFDSLIEQNR